MKISYHWKTWLVVGLVLACAAMAFGYHVPADAVGAASLLMIGDTDNVGAEIKALLQKQGENFEEFKKTNDEMLKAKAEGKAVADLEAKLANIDTEFKKLGEDVVELTKKAARPVFDKEGKNVSPEQEEYKKALHLYLRKGITDELREKEQRAISSMFGGEQKAMSSFSDPDGGWFVGVEMDTEVDRIATTLSAMRQVANVRTIGGAKYEKYVKTRGISGGHLAEHGDSAESDEPQWAKIEIDAHGNYAEPWVPNAMLEDFVFDLESDLTAEAGITLAAVEGADFITGNGVDCARGIASYTTVANASYAWGSVGYIAAGGAGAFTTSAPGDKIVQLVHALKPSYRPGAVFMMNDATLATVRQMKDGSGQYYLWQVDPTAGFGGRLMGAQVVVDDNLADIAANSLSIAFGNFKRAYTIADRSGIALIRDNVTKKGVTKFHFTKRVGGGITNFEAIKFMKFAAS